MSTRWTDFELRCARAFWLQLRHADVTLTPLCHEMINVNSPIQYRLRARKEEMQRHKPALMEVLQAEGIPLGQCEACKARPEGVAV